MPTPTIEEYLEAIYVLASDGEEVIGARLGEALGVSPPTVTATVQRMARDGLIQVGPRKEIALTASGQQAVETVLRRHRLSERLLVDVLGMPWHEVHDEACRLEHAISPEVEERLARFLGDPATCPHGNPIPGKEQPAGEFRLADAAAGDWLVISRVAQKAEAQVGVLEYLAQRGLLPGSRVYVTEIGPFNGPIVLQVGERGVALGRDLAAMLWVAPDGETAQSSR